ncbi:EF hand [Allorhodopirellula solitaria]|uniref:EF hand n=2 Tax=Allorhodopirellula solitaria TaxID=2527987 RepID=A0A5C5YEN8_9BACT|nr:EF hand [Allorhodopirellula solitaria]
MERLLSLDKDGDGELSKDELADLPVGGQRLLKAGDGNEDGALSSDELSTLKERGQDFWKQRRERAEQSE